MNDLTEKKKIIIASFILFLLIGGYIFLQYKLKSDIVIDSNFDSEVEFDETEEIQTLEKVEEIKPEPPREIIVYVCGQVKNPGVIKLLEEQRVNNAIQIAGGSLEQADLNKVNLARKIVDGERIYIPKIGETVENYSIGTNKKINKLVNINTSSISELDTIPEIGPATASKIIEYRQQYGSFKSVEQIKNVSGIGEKKYKTIKKYITI